MENFNKKFLSIILLILIGFQCVAQQDPPPPGPPVTPPGLPIDGGVLYAVFFALAYGASKLIKKKD